MCLESLLCLQIFTRILRSLNLPVGVNQMVAPQYLTNAYDTGHLVLLITALLVNPVVSIKPTLHYRIMGSIIAFQQLQGFVQTYVVWKSLSSLTLM